MIDGLLTILGCSVLMAVLAVPLMLRKVPRNRIYGFRSKATLRDDRMWYEANAFFGRGLFAAGIVTAVSMLFLYAAPDLSPLVFFKAVAATPVAPQLVTMLLTVRFVRKLEARYRADNGRNN